MKIFLSAARSIFVLSWLVSLALLVPISGTAQKSRTKKPVLRGNVVLPPSELPPEKLNRLKAFYQVWSAINEYYYDPKFGGLNWESVRRTYEPKVRAAKTDSEVHVILETMIGLLKRSHLAIIPPEVYEAIETAKEEVRERDRALDEQADLKNPGTSSATEKAEIENDPNVRFGIGIDLRLIEDKFIISRLQKGSSAETTGLKTGLSIEKINGISMRSLLDEITRHYGAEKASKFKLQLPIEITESILTTVYDGPVNLTVSDETGSVRDVAVPRKAIRDLRPFAAFSDLPEKMIVFESRSISEKVGYIRFNYFGLPIIERFCAAISEHKSKDALVIDLRSNLGGLVGTMPVLAGMLSPQITHVGTMQYRSSEEVILSKSLPKHFQGRIVVLVDNATASAGEIFAQLLREHGRAVVVGQRTAGEALPSTTVRLSTGAIFLFPIANFKSESGRYLEGIGLEPDQTVVMDRKSLLAGIDSQLDAAVKLAGDNEAFVKLKTTPLPQTVSSKTTAGRSVTDPRGPMSFINRAPVVEAPREFAPGHDEKASGFLRDFLTLIGGKAALQKLSSYTLESGGKIDISGREVALRVRIFRESQDRYGEHFLIPDIGETRQFVFGKKAFYQSELEPGKEFPFPQSVNEVDPFGVFFELAKVETVFPSLSFTGEYDRLGRKTAVIDGKDLNGDIIALAFDVESRLLVNISGKLRNVSFGDYRKVGDVKLPFSIERDGVALTVDSIKTGEPIDKANFERRQYCYDKP